MHKIRDWLYVGKAKESREAQQLAAYKIEAILQLAEPVVVPGVAALYLPLGGEVRLSDSLLRQGLDFVLGHKAQGDTTLIACRAGVSRSAALAVAAIKEAEGLSLLDALRAVKAHHPHAMPQPVLWRALCRYYRTENLFRDF